MSAPRILRTKLRRDVRRQWPQFAAVTVTILLGVALFGASYDAYRNLDASYTQVFVDEEFADVFVTGGDAPAIAAAVADLAGVTEVRTRIEIDAAMRIGPDKLRGRVVGIPPGHQPAVNRIEVRSGAYPNAGALVEQHAATHFDLGAGDEVEVLAAAGWEPVALDGVVLSGEYLWPARSRQEFLTLPDDFAVLFVTDQRAQQLAGHGPNQVLLRLASDADAEAVIAQVRDVAVSHGATQVFTRAEQPSNALLREDVDGFSQMAVAFPVLFLGAAAMATYVLLTRRVRSEREVIGMLLASGMPRRHLLGHYLGFGVAAGAIGGLLGTAIGLVAARSLSTFYVGFIGLPADRAVIEVRLLTVLAGVLYGVVAGVVAAAAPALLASRTPPAEAMRAVVPTTGGRRSLLERVVPPLRRLPARWRMVLRGIGRSRRRTAYTMLGVMLSLLLVLVSWTMIDTMDELLAVQFDVVTQQDARVDLVAPADEQQLQALAAVDGVAVVEAATTLPVGLQSSTDTYGTILQVLRPDTEMHAFRRPDGTRVDLPDNGLLVGRAVADLLDVEVGDTVALVVEPLARTVSVPIDDFVDEPLGTFAYLSRPQAAALFGGDVPATTALLRLDADADRDAVRRTVSDLPMVASYEDAQAVRQLFEQFTGLFYAFMGGMLVLGGLMAFAMIFTTMSVNIVERAREVATLRASGMHARTVSRLIAAENMLVAALGIVPGLVLGVVGGTLMLRTYTTDQFSLDIVIRPLTLVVAVVTILLVAAVSQVPGLRAVRRLDIATVVRERVT